jgi:hypothetical protein
MFSAHKICDWFIVYVMVTMDWWKDSAPSGSTSVAAQHVFPPPPPPAPFMEKWAYINACLKLNETGKEKHDKIKTVDRNEATSNNASLNGLNI